MLQLIYLHKVNKHLKIKCHIAIKQYVLHKRVDELVVDASKVLGDSSFLWQQLKSEKCNNEDDGHCYVAAEEDAIFLQSEINKI